MGLASRRLELHWSGNRISRLLRRPRPDARRWALLVLGIGTLAVFGVAVVYGGSLLASGAEREAREDAEADAQLLTDLGLAAVLADGQVGAGDVRIARAQIAAAQRNADLIGVVVRNLAGEVIFSDGESFERADAGLSKLAREALASGGVTSGNAEVPGSTQATVAALPLQAGRLRLVAEFAFADDHVRSGVAQARRKLYAVAGGAALLVFLVMLPLLARLARRLPTHIDRARPCEVKEFRRALDRHEFTVHYQPKIAVETGDVVGVEALARWNHPRRGVLFPGEFLPAVETSPNLLTAMTSDILDRALGDCTRWLKDGHRLPVAVNIAASTILLCDLLTDAVRDALGRHGVDPRMLTLEITESAITERADEAVERLGKLRELGVAVSIDDFGTGHSSLARLQALPLDELKVDRSFIRGIARDERDHAIARLIVSVGAELGLQVVAEGVEDARTLAVLAELGCPVVQGFLFSRPLAEPELRAWLGDRVTAAGEAMAPGPRAPAGASWVGAITENA